MPATDIRAARYVDTRCLVLTYAQPATDLRAARHRDTRCPVLTCGVSQGRFSRRFRRRRLCRLTSECGSSR
eukprot:194166-Rhodomonas_salina.1